MEQKERMDQGLIYDPADNRISTEQTSCLDAQYEFNATHPSEMKKRAALLKQMLGAIGENCYIEPPFRANWGGKHMLNQAAGDRKILADRLNISSEQLAYVTNSEPGHGLLFFNNVILPFADDFPKDTELYKLLTTKPSEMEHSEV